MKHSNEKGYAFTLNKTPHIWERYISETDFRQHFNIAEDLAIFLALEGFDQEIVAGEKIDLAPEAIEEFYTVPRNPERDILINKKPFKWKERYISEEQIRQLGHIPSHENIYYSVQGPDELVVTGKPINVARMGVEEFYSLPDKPHGHVILTIESTKGKWIRHVFAESLTIAAVIKLVVAHFGFVDDGNYELKIKNGDDLLPANTLESYHLPDCSILTFTDLGKGA